MIEEIIGENNLLLAIIIRSSFSNDGVNFITQQDNYLQVGILTHKQGNKIKPHFHKNILREINYTQEVLHIEYGKIEASFYQNKKIVRNCSLNSGDTIILIQGGHGFNIIEDTKMIEIKQGPYIDPSKDKELI